MPETNHTTGSQPTARFLPAAARHAGGSHCAVCGGSGGEFGIETVPCQLARREERIARLKAARTAMEARFDAYRREKEAGKQAVADRLGKEG